MRSRRKKLALLLIPLGALALLLASPPARRFYRYNEARYLLNEHRFVDALRAYNKLAADPASIGEEHNGFPREALQRASVYYLDPDHAGLELSEGFGHFIQETTNFPELADETLRLRLRANIRNGIPARDALQAAGAILAKGYDAEALWWQTVGQYQLQRPLRIPQTLKIFRTELENAPSPTNETFKTKDDAIAARHLTYLRALLAIDDADWARAASLFEDYRRDPLPNTPHELPYGLALMRSGQMQRAVQIFLDFSRSHPKQGLSEELAIECSLRTRDYARAAELMRQLRIDHPGSEVNMLRRTFPDVASANDALTALAATLTQFPERRADVGLWQWCDAVAQTAQQRQAVRSAAESIGRVPTAPCDAARLLQYALREQDHALAMQIVERSFAAAQAIPATSGPQTSLAATTTTLPLSAAARTLAQWYPTAETAATSPPLATVQPGLLLASQTTQRTTLALPAGASILLLMAQGYAPQGIWPLVNIAVDGFEERLYDVCSEQNRAIPLIYVLDRPRPSATSATLSLSLINGSGEGANAPSLLLADVFVF